MAGKYVLIGDVHATEHAPSSCTDSYMPDLLDLLEQVRRLCITVSAEALVIAGDVFHHKAPGRTNHRLVQSLIRLFQSVPCPVAITPGNHDLQNDRLESIDVTQPLGVIFASGAAQRLEGWWDDEHGALAHPLYGVPWQQEWSESSITGALLDYTDPTDGQWEKPMLVVTHAPIYPPGHELKWENTPAEWWARAMGGAGYLFYGHVHEPHGVFLAGGTTFCNNGALSRGSLHEYNLKRPVIATVWDSGTGEFEPAELEARPAGEVFRLAEHEKDVTAQDRLAGFLASVQPAQLTVMSVETVIGQIRNTDGVDPEVRELAVSLLEDQHYGGKQ